MIEYGEKTYELKYGLKRVELIEAATGSPMMAELSKNNAMLGLSSLKTYFAYGLKEEGADAFVPPKEGMEIAESLIENEGYIVVCGMVLEALERDCPFFFRGA